MTPVLLLAASASLSCASPATVKANMDASIYDRAVEFLPANRDRLVLNVTVTPHWRPGQKDHFSYRKALGEGRSAFVMVDAETGSQRPAFDQAAVALGLTKALGKPIAADRLPFLDFDQVTSNAIAFDLNGGGWSCSIITPVCRVTRQTPADPTAVPSPDGKWLAFNKGPNHWIRSADGGRAFALTTDGEPHFAYGAAPEISPVNGPSPSVLWSPDSTRIFVQKMDERRVRDITIVQSTPTDGTVRPKATTIRYAMPNDADVPMAESWIFELGSGAGRKVGMSPIPLAYEGSIQAREAWWSQDSRRVYLFWRARYAKRMSLEAIEAIDGSVRTILPEAGKTFVEAAHLGQRPMGYTLADGDVIWFSERDGHGRLYLYDGADGRLKRQLTYGAWSIRNVLRVDEERGLIYVVGTEREPQTDPYYRSIYKIRLNDGEVNHLSPEAADHYVAAIQDSIRGPSLRLAQVMQGFSPSGRYFVDNISRPDMPNVAILRREDGTKVAEIDRADVSRLTALGATKPERFTTMAADGITVIYGVILRPTHFDPAKCYPVIDSPYPGPQGNRVFRPRFVDLVFDSAQSLAALGFVVVLVDGRGTPGRSKTFLDESYGRLGQAGHMDDHVAAIKALAAKYRYMDTSRVGVYGGSGGGFAAAHAMFSSPDFYKVGVVDAGNHDQRGYLQSWGETYNGPEVGDNYKDASNARLAFGVRPEGKTIVDAR